jgi:hypothetical protein
LENLGGGHLKCWLLSVFSATEISCGCLPRDRW